MNALIVTAFFQLNHLSKTISGKPAIWDIKEKVNMIVTKMKKGTIVAQRIAAITQQKIYHLLNVRLLFYILNV